MDLSRLAILVTMIKLSGKCINLFKTGKLLYQVDVADEGDFDNCGCDGINDNMIMKRCQIES